MYEVNTQTRTEAWILSVAPGGTRTAFAQYVSGDKI